MPISPEESQKVTDMRSRMLANVAQGRSAWEGFSKEELREGLAILQGGRARSAEAATVARKKKATKSNTPVDMSFLAKLGLD